MKLPTSLGATIDLLYALRAERLALGKTLKEMQEKETAIELHLMNNFAKGDLEGARGKVATASLKYTTVADVTDWDAYYAYVAKNKAWELLQKRVGITALRERWDAKKQVPGVEPKTITDISLTKASR